MTEKFNFTKQAIERLESPPKGKAKWFHDTKSRGLAVRVTDTGSKTFYSHRWAAGRNQQKKLGPFPDMTIDQARRLADEINAIIARGEDPSAVRKNTRGEWTFGELFEWFMGEHGDKRQSAPKWRTQYQRHLSHMASWKVSRVTKDVLKDLHKKLGVKDAHPYEANRVIALVRSIFNVAIKEGEFTGVNPAVGIDAFEEVERARWIMPSELPAFFQALEEELNADIRDYVLLSLFTGARKSNVLAMAWDNVYLDDQEWHIPRTKNGQFQVVPLLEAELEVLQRRLRERQPGNPWVFPGRGKTGHMVEPKSGWARILKRAGLQNLRIHDLRRTLASVMRNSGEGLDMVGKLLHHKSPTATLIYARIAVDPLRQAKQKTHLIIQGAAKGNEALGSGSTSVVQSSPSASDEHIVR